MSLSITNVDKLRSMSALQPSNIIQHSLDHSMRHIFVDNEPTPDPDTPPIIYEIPSAGIMELHGASQWCDLSISEFNSLLHQAICNVDAEDSLLEVIRRRLERHLSSHPRSFAKDITGFIEHQFTNFMEELIQGHSDDDTFMADVEELQTIINTIKTEGRYSIL